MNNKKRSTTICPSQSNNKDRFSFSHETCRYHGVNAVSNLVTEDNASHLTSINTGISDNPATFPKGSLRMREPTKMKKDISVPKYLRYSVPNATKALDLSWSWPEDSSEFPKDIYNKEPFAGSIDYWHSPRDPEWLYTFQSDRRDEIPPEYWRERTKHTETQSHFGYNFFDFSYPPSPSSSGVSPSYYGLNYGTGEQSRGYVEPPVCHEPCNDSPPNVAPSRFYTPFYLKGSYTEFRKMNDSRIPATMMLK